MRSERLKQPGELSKNAPRRERREAMRQAQKNTSSHDTSVFSRRNLLLASGLTVAGVGGLAWRYGIETQSGSDSPYQDIIDNFLPTSSITPDSAERELWGIQSVHDVSRLSAVEKVEAERNRIHRIADSFAVSSIPTFQEKYSDYHELIKNQQLQLTAELNLDSYFGDFVLMTQALRDHERLITQINSDSEALSQIESDMAVGTLVAHEIDHASEWMKYINSQDQTKNLDERIEDFREYRRLNVVLHEQSAYAVQATAFLEARGKGVIDLVPEDMIEVVAMYIQSGQDKDDPRWVSYIRSRIPPQDLPKGEPKG